MTAASPDKWPSPETVERAAWAIHDFEDQEGDLEHFPWYRDMARAVLRTADVDALVEAAARRAWDEGYGAGWSDGGDANCAGLLDEDEHHNPYGGGDPMTWAPRKDREIQNYRCCEHCGGLEGDLQHPEGHDEHDVPCACTPEHCIGKEASDGP